MNEILQSRKVLQNWIQKFYNNSGISTIPVESIKNENQQAILWVRLHKYI